MPRGRVLAFGGGLGWLAWTWNLMHLESGALLGGFRLPLHLDNCDDRQKLLTM